MEVAASAALEEAVPAVEPAPAADALVSTVEPEAVAGSGMEVPASAALEEAVSAVEPALAAEALVSAVEPEALAVAEDRKSTRLNSSHLVISYAVFCLKKKKQKQY